MNALYHAHNETYGIVKVMGTVEDCISPYCKEAVYRRDNPKADPRCTNCGRPRAKHLCMRSEDRDFPDVVLMCPGAVFEEARVNA